MKKLISSGFRSSVYSKTFIKQVNYGVEFCFCNSEPFEFFCVFVLFSPKNIILGKGGIEIL